MSRPVREFVKGCSTCQRNKSEHLHTAGLLQEKIVIIGLQTIAFAIIGLQTLILLI